MGKTKKAQKSKRKKSTKPANENETAANSADNTSGGEKDGKKSPKEINRSTEDIQAAGYSPQETQKVGKKDNIKLTYKVQTAEQSSESMGLDIDDENLKGITGAIEEAVREYMDFHEMKHPKGTPARQKGLMLDLPPERYGDLNEFFISQSPIIAKHFYRCMKIMRDQYNRASSAEDSLTAVKSEGHGEISAIKELEDDENVTATTIQVGDNLDEKIIDLKTKDNKKGKKKSKDKESPSDDVQKAMHSPYKLLEGMKGGKDNKCSDNILTSEHSPQNVDSKKEGIKSKVSNIPTSGIQESELCAHRRELDNKDEALIEQIDEAAGNEEETKYVLEMKHSEKMKKNKSHEQNKCKKSLPEFKHDLREFLTSQSSKLDEQMMKSRSSESALNILREKRNLFSTEIDVANAEADEIRVTKQLADQANYAIEKLEKLESQKIGNKSKKESDSSADCIQADEHFQNNVTEGKKDAKNDKKDNEKFNEGNRRICLDKGMQKPIPKTEECVRKEKDILPAIDPNNMTKSKTPEKTEDTKKSGGDFQRDLEDFFAFQGFKLDEQVKKCRGVVPELKFVKIEPDLLPSDKETVTAVQKTEERKEIRVPKELKYEKTGINCKLDIDGKEIFLHSEKNNIHFEFETNGDKHILLGDNYFCFKEEEKQDLELNAEEEKIRISFIGSQIFISTPNSEFEISFRTPPPANLSANSTQTDTLQ